MDMNPEFGKRRLDVGQAKDFNFFPKLSKCFIL